MVKLRQSSIRKTSDVYDFEDNTPKTDDIIKSVSRGSKTKATKKVNLTKGSNNSKTNVTISDKALNKSKKIKSILHKSRLGLNSTISRKTILKNNQALAAALENVKQENKILQDNFILMQSQNYELMLKLRKTNQVTNISEIKEQFALVTRSVNNFKNQYTFSINELNARLATIDREIEEFYKKLSCCQDPAECELLNRPSIYQCPTDGDDQNVSHNKYYMCNNHSFTNLAAPLPYVSNNNVLLPAKQTVHFENIPTLPIGTHYSESQLSTNNFINPATNPTSFQTNHIHNNILPITTSAMDPFAILRQQNLKKRYSFFESSAPAILPLSLGYEVQNTNLPPLQNNSESENVITKLPNNNCIIPQSCVITSINAFTDVPPSLLNNKNDENISILPPLKTAMNAKNVIKRRGKRHEPQPISGATKTGPPTFINSNDSLALMPKITKKGDVFLPKDIIISTTQQQVDTLEATNTLQSESFTSCNINTNVNTSPALFLDNRITDGNLIIDYTIDKTTPSHINTLNTIPNASNLNTTHASYHEIKGKAIRSRRSELFKQPGIQIKKFIDNDKTTTLVDLNETQTLPNTHPISENNSDAPLNNVPISTSALNINSKLPTVSPLNIVEISANDQEHILRDVYSPIISKVEPNTTVTNINNINANLNRNNTYIANENPDKLTVNKTSFSRKRIGRPNLKNKILTPEESQTKRESKRVLLANAIDKGKTTTRILDTSNSVESEPKTIKRRKAKGTLLSSPESAAKNVKKISQKLTTPERISNKQQQSNSKSFFQNKEPNINQAQSLVNSNNRTMAITSSSSDLTPQKYSDFLHISNLLPAELINQSNNNHWNPNVNNTSFVVCKNEKQPTTHTSEMENLNQMTFIIEHPRIKPETTSMMDTDSNQHQKQVRIEQIINSIAAHKIPIKHGKEVEGSTKTPGIYKSKYLNHQNHTPEILKSPKSNNKNESKQVKNSILLLDGKTIASPNADTIKKIKRESTLMDEKKTNKKTSNANKDASVHKEVLARKRLVNIPNYKEPKLNKKMRRGDPGSIDLSSQVKEPTKIKKKAARKGEVIHPKMPNDDSEKHDMEIGTKNKIKKTNIAKKNASNDQTNNLPPNHNLISDKSSYPPTSEFGSLPIIIPNSIPQNQPNNVIAGNAKHSTIIRHDIQDKKTANKNVDFKTFYPINSMISDFFISNQTLGHSQPNDKSSVNVKVNHAVDEYKGTGFNHTFVHSPTQISQNGIQNKHTIPIIDLVSVDNPFTGHSTSTVIQSVQKQPYNRVSVIANVLNGIRTYNS